MDFSGMPVRMKTRYTILAALAAFVALGTSLSVAAVDTSAIDQVRKKQVLNDADLQVIDNFIFEVLSDLMVTRDWTQVSQTRNLIVSRKDGQSQYVEQFRKSARKHIADALKNAAAVPEADRKFRITLNLLILLDELADARLVDLALDYVDSDNLAIRLWAVHCLTNPAVVEQLNADAEGFAVARNILQRLKKILNDSNREIAGRIITFAHQIRIPEGEQLILEVADARIKQYENWAVKDELLDERILRVLGDRLASGQGGPEVARRFAQLYSYVIQRYVRDINDENFLTPQQRSELAWVIVEIERACIGKILGTPQANLRMAVAGNDPARIMMEHNVLLGEQQSGPGALANKLGFDYDPDPEQNRDAPLQLPPRPEPTSPAQ